VGLPFLVLVAAGAGVRRAVVAGASMSAGACRRNRNEASGEFLLQRGRIKTRRKKAGKLL
jgi:hypothetical protein